MLRSKDLLGLRNTGADEIREILDTAKIMKQPAHVNIDSLIVRPRAQASNTVVARH